MVKIDKNLVFLKKNKIIKNKKGNIYKIINKNDENYKKFGELYLSKINYNQIKGWKLHKRMFMNLFVPFGKIKIIIVNELDKSLNKQNNCKFKSYIISSRNNYIINIPPKKWFGFKGLSKPNSILGNFSNIIHNDNEVITKDIKYFNIDWNK